MAMVRGPLVEAMMLKGMAPEGKALKRGGTGTEDVGRGDDERDGFGGLGTNGEVGSAHDTLSGHNVTVICFRSCALSSHPIPNPAGPIPKRSQHS